uniref:G-protein coupled receptors family 3 profile domain-containing protein n=1 Tax=Sinocyclocheilus grahami TaxID=75366 RepID=A0A672LED3_SINGR
GISMIGTVLGVTVQYTEFCGFEDFERHSVPRLKDIGLNSPFSHSVPCMENTKLYEIAIQGFSMSQYDDVSSFNVYKAVHMVAHALHNILHCDSGLCQKYNVQPWEVSCPYGHRKLMTGQHKCCFDCMACPAATFPNKTSYTFSESETCNKRAELYLPWGASLTTALLIYLGVTLFLTLGTAVIFLFNLSTPVVKSAGGKTCLLMLASLTVASCSTLCHFSRPSHTGCLLKQPLFIISFTVCLACATVRSFQVYRALYLTM